MKIILFDKTNCARPLYRNIPFYNHFPLQSYVQKCFGFEFVFIVYRSNTQQQKSTSSLSPCSFHAFITSHISCLSLRKFSGRTYVQISVFTWSSFKIITDGRVVRGLQVWRMSSIKTVFTHNYLRWTYIQVALCKRIAAFHAWVTHFCFRPLFYLYLIMYNENF